MSESLILPESSSRQIIYNALLPQLEALLENETDLIANLANTVAVLKEAFQFFWVGFYLVKEGQLVLGPFQGSIACTRIAFTRGVCGHAYTMKKIVIVPDVDQFPGHIACSSLSKSEIVIPLFKRNAQGLPTEEVIALLDVDSDRLADFSEIDSTGLRAMMDVVERKVRFCPPDSHEQ